MPITLGILAQARIAPPPAAGSFDLIETVSLSSNAASVTFSNLNNFASTYRHLQIRAVYRASADNLFTMVRFNGDTGFNYSRHQLGGDGSSVFSSGDAGQSEMWAGKPPFTAISGNFNPDVIDILDPFVTTKFTTIRSISGYTGSTPFVLLRSGAWRNTNAVTSITLASNEGTYVSGSRFSLYGIKG